MRGSTQKKKKKVAKNCGVIMDLNKDYILFPIPSIMFYNTARKKPKEESKFNDHIKIEQRDSKGFTTIITIYSLR